MDARTRGSPFRSFAAVIATLSDHRRGATAGHSALARRSGGLTPQPSWPSAVSADGSVVVGRAWSPEGFQAFRWTRKTGMVGLGDLPGGGKMDSAAWGVSADGSVIVGQAESDLGHEAFIWTAGTGMVGLGDLPGGFFRSFAASVSDDGLVIGGTASSDKANAEAFIWTVQSGMIGLGDLPGGDVLSTVIALDAAGSCALGTSSSALGKEPFLWTQQTGMVGLGLVPGQQHTTPTDLSLGGETVVGLSQSDGDEWAYGFRWTSSGGYESLADLPGGEPESQGLTVSDDGGVIGGRAWNELGTVATLWMDPASPIELKEYLLSEYQLDASEWYFSDIMAMSGDGRTLTGVGSFKGAPYQGIHAWVVIPGADCYGDCTQDGALDLFDFLCFVNLFNAGDPFADCTEDQTLDLFDFLCFVNAFNQC
jgi:probable HAF family extracellular repeat protein